MTKVGLCLIVILIKLSFFTTYFSDCNYNHNDNQKKSIISIWNAIKNFGKIQEVIKMYWNKYCKLVIDINTCLSE